MASTIFKDAGAGVGSDTTLTLNNFDSVNTDYVKQVEAIGDILGDEEDAILIDYVGPTMSITFSWNITNETSNVVSGAGSPVTTAVGQFLYVNTTLKSFGVDQITDLYTVTLDYGGGNTLVRTGMLGRLVCVQTSQEPLTWRATMTITVGTK